MRCASKVLSLLLLLSACQKPESARQLTPGEPVKSPIQQGETQAWSLSLKSGQYAGVVVDQQGVDVIVTLLDPENRRLASIDSPQGSNVPEPAPLLATLDGSYRLEIQAPEGSGSYAIRIDAIRPATPGDRTRVQAERLLSQGEELRRRDDRNSRETAAERARQSANLFQKLADSSREADALYTLGSALYGLDDNIGARDTYEQALTLFHETGREREAGKVLNALGRTWRRQEPGRALEIYREALDLNRRLGDEQQEATTLQNLGKTYQSLGETEEALAHYERALPIWRKLGVKSEEAGTLLALGDLYQRMGEPRKALDLLPRAIALFEAAGAQGDAAAALTTLGDAQARDGKVQEALASLTRALGIQRRIGNRREEAQALNSIGCCHLLLGRPEEARRSLEAARTIFHQIGDRAAEAVALVNLGLAHEERPRLAIRSFETAMPLLVSGEHEALALLGSARAHRRLGDFATARKEAEEAIGKIESLRGKSASLGMRASFLTSKQDYYGFYMDLLMELGHEAEALAASEKARARSLLDLLSVDLRLEVQEDRRINDLAQRPAGPELRELLMQQDRVRKASGQAIPLTVREIQREVADKDTLLLQYALGPERSFLWAVTPDSLTSFELPPR
ncbi:MAG TPA: tetratricopeptide repeat protein, partial [Thermoanaerobaculia bacterium]|nr:tetratricopeptide repeat protein [Thermoanaerobaculia bacterium]